MIIAADCKAVAIVFNLPIDAVRGLRWLKIGPAHVHGNAVRGIACDLVDIHEIGLQSLDAEARGIGMCNAAAAMIGFASLAAGAAAAVERSAASIAGAAAVKSKTAA